MKTKHKIEITWQAFTAIGGALAVAIFYTIAFAGLGTMSLPFASEADSYGFEAATIALSWVIAAVSVLALFFNKKAARSGIFSALFIVNVLIFILGIMGAIFDEDYVVDNPEWNGIGFGISEDAWSAEIALVVVAFVIGLVTESVWFGIENKKGFKKAVADGWKQERVKTKPNGVQIATLVFAVLSACILLMMFIYAMMMMFAD